MSITGVEGVNLLALYRKGSHVGWNEFLRECDGKADVNRLARMRRALQIGMNDLVKKKLNHSDIDEWFLRLQKSIEDTAKKIIRRRHPNPLDSGVNQRLDESGQSIDPKIQAIKRKRDAELEAFFRKSSF